MHGLKKIIQMIIVAILLSYSQSAEGESKKHCLWRHYTSSSACHMAGTLVPRSKPRCQATIVLIGEAIPP